MAAARSAVRRAIKAEKEKKMKEEEEKEKEQERHKKKSGSFRGETTTQKMTRKQIDNAVAKKKGDSPSKTPVKPKRTLSFILRELTKEKEKVNAEKQNKSEANDNTVEDNNNTGKSPRKWRSNSLNVKNQKNENKVSRNSSFQHGVDENDDDYMNSIHEDFNHAEDDEPQEDHHDPFFKRLFKDRRKGAHTSPQKMKSFKNLKALRYLIRENEQLQDQLHVPLPTEHHPAQDDMMNQVRQPYYNQVLLKRIETLEADREILRQLNKSLTFENEGMKMKKQHGNEIKEDPKLDFLSQLRDSSVKFPATEEPRVHREINDLKNQIATLNDDLMEYKKLTSLTSEMLDSSFSRPHPDAAAVSPTLNTSHTTYKTGFVPYHQWENLCEQSKLVLEENQLLVDQKTLYKKTINDLTENYQTEVSKLNTQLSNTVKEKKALDRQLSEMESELSHLRSRCTTMNERVESSVEKSEHERKIERINKDHMNEIDDLKSEVKRITASLEAVNNEKSRLAIQVTDVTAVNSRLTMELRIAEKNVRRADRQLYKCMAELQNVCNKEITAKGTLAEVLKLAEKTSYEREQMAAMVASQKEKTQVALEQIHKDDMTLQELRKELKNTKERRKSQFVKIKQHILDQEEEVSGIIGNYQEEMRGLKHIIREKQGFIDHMRSDKQLTESRLDEMWRSLHPPYPIIKGYEGRS